MGVPHCAAAFEEIHVDGGMLLEITDDDLVHDLGIEDTNDRARLMAALGSLCRGGDDDDGAGEDVGGAEAPLREAVLLRSDGSAVLRRHPE